MEIKLQTKRAEEVESAMDDSLNPQTVIAYDQVETKRILRKVDYRLVPMLAVLYLFSFLDRGNLGNAKIIGLNTDLNLTPAQYNMALTVFFFPYALLEVPSNIVLKLLRPSIWIAIMMVSWGTVVTLMGLVKNYNGLVISRVFLGVCETGFFPAATFLLTTWYTRFEVQTRMAMFYSAASLGGAFSGLLAYAIDYMDGVAGLHGWRWIFILEGIITVLIGVSCVYLLPDSPATASFLKPDERMFLVQRLRMDSGSTKGTVGVSEAFQWKYIVAGLTDWKVWLSVAGAWGNNVSIYGFIYTAPTVIVDLGYSAAHAQLLTIPIYAFSMIMILVTARIADKMKTRTWVIVVPFCISIVGYIGLLSIPHPKLPGLTYALLFLVAGGTYAPYMGIISWLGNNLAGSWKRAVGMSLLISIGNLGGAVGSNIYLQQQKPRYWLGYGMGLGIQLTAVCTTLLMRFLLNRINNARDRVSEEEITATYSEQELMELGDKSPYYRYVL